MLPNFFVVGVQKAATTSLHNYLIHHPEIYLPARKESQFFIDDSRYSKGIVSYEEENFSDWNGEPAVGEIDPDYIYFEKALERMALHLDLASTKFIFIFRNPVDRAFSHYLMTYRRGLEPLSFEEAIKKESARIAKDYLANMHYSYVRRGYYMHQVNRFLSEVDRSQMLFLLMEDLKVDPRGTLCTIFKFLGVTTTFTPPNMKEEFHRASVPFSMKLLHRIKGQSFEKNIVRLLIPWKDLRQKLRQKLLDLNQITNHNFNLNDDTRKQLSGLFREENKRLGDFIERDLRHWNSGIEHQQSNT